jgi:uncharacterized membrane protein (DUF4010 family)
MFPRVLIETVVLAPPVFKRLLLPLSLAMVVYLLGAAWLAWRATQAVPKSEADAHLAVNNPFEIVPALRFTAVLVAIMLAVTLANDWFGDAGIYLTAAISGAADVDAITLSLSQLAAKDGIAPEIAARGVLIAAVANSLVKITLVGFIGGTALLVRMAPFALIGLLIAVVSSALGVL